MGGKLRSTPTASGHRVRYLSDGAVVGSCARMETHLRGRRGSSGTLKSPRLLPTITDWGDLTALRGVRRQTFGGPDQAPGELSRNT